MVAPIFDSTPCHPVTQCAMPCLIALCCTIPCCAVACILMTCCAAHDMVHSAAGLIELFEIVNFPEAIPFQRACCRKLGSQNSLHQRTSNEFSRKQTWNDFFGDSTCSSKCIAVVHCAWRDRSRYPRSILFRTVLRNSTCCEDP